MSVVWIWKRLVFEGLIVILRFLIHFLKKNTNTQWISKNTFRSQFQVAPFSVTFRWNKISLNSTIYFSCFVIFNNNTNGSVDQYKNILGRLFHKIIFLTHNHIMADDDMFDDDDAEMVSKMMLYRINAINIE